MHNAALAEEGCHVILSVATTNNAVVKALSVGHSLPLGELTGGTGTVVGRPHNSGRNGPCAFAPLDWSQGNIGIVACAGERIEIRATDVGDPV